MQECVCVSECMWVCVCFLLLPLPIHHPPPRTHIRIWNSSHCCFYCRWCVSELSRFPDISMINDIGGIYGRYPSPSPLSSSSNPLPQIALCFCLQNSVFGSIVWIFPSIFHHPTPLRLGQMIYIGIGIGEGCSREASPGSLLLLAILWSIEVSNYLSILSILLILSFNDLKGVLTSTY